jgi:uncharacterized repeat protein (TIGR03803 family)
MGQRNGAGLAMAAPSSKSPPSGKLTTLYNFCSQTNCTDGEYPYAGLVQATDGNFYGTTLTAEPRPTNVQRHLAAALFLKSHLVGRSPRCTVFAPRPTALTAPSPYAGLVQAAGGNFYGTTSAGGSNNLGTVFKITQAAR